MTGPRRLLFSLHDATPFHLERLRRAEEVFAEAGLRKAAYLFVPKYHGSYPAEESAEFIAWCRGPRPFQVEWFLHGYRHLEDAPAGGGGTGGGAGDAWKRRLLTAGEGEFLALDEAAMRERLQAGLDSFRRCLGADPSGFIAPAWLFNPGLLPLLRELGIPYTEDHRRLHRPGVGALESPVVTWATRTFLRKHGSLAVCPLLAALWSERPVLRVAVHPFDFDHPATVRSIRSVLRRVLAYREQSLSSDIEIPARAA